MWYAAAAGEVTVIMRLKDRKAVTKEF